MAKACSVTMSQCVVCGTSPNARLNRALTCSSCIGDRCVCRMVHGRYDLAANVLHSLTQSRQRLATVCAKRDALRAQACAQLQLVRLVVKVLNRRPR
jgi:hypothetical protein